MTEWCCMTRQTDGLSWGSQSNRRADCNCQALNFGSHGFLLHWSQSYYTCSPSFQFPNSTCRTDLKIWGGCGNGKLPSLALKPQIQNKSESWSKSAVCQLPSSAFYTEYRQLTLKICWGCSQTGGYLPTHAGLCLWAIGLPKAKLIKNTLIKCLLFPRLKPFFILTYKLFS